MIGLYNRPLFFGIYNLVGSCYLYKLVGVLEKGLCTCGKVSSTELSF